MRRPLKRALAVSTLLTLASTSALGWSVALHLAIDDHHEGDPSHDGGGHGLEVALHGHAHEEGTPPHGHPVVASFAAPVPGKLLQQIGATVGDASEMVVAGISTCRRLAPTGPTHDPPPRVQAASVLRI